jgi:fatty acyl-CoA reductase
MKVKPQQMLEVAKWLDRDSLTSLKNVVFEGRPNTYTFTKALAEHYIKENKRDLNVAIARPSIVTATWRQPVSGWVDSYNGPGGASLLGSLGIARTMCFNPNNTADLIPVDIVANALINIAWKTALTSKDSDSREKELKVYNITSGSINPISWHHYLEYGRNRAIECPSTRVVRPPARVMTGKGHSAISNFLTKWVSEVMFAILLDCILFVAGKKPMVYRVVRKMHHAFDLLAYFVRREWSFPSTNLQALIQEIKEVSPEDSKTFYMDVSEVDWPQYIGDCYMGFRRYLMKEPDSNVPEGRNQLKKVSIMYNSFLVFLSILLLTIIYFFPYMTVFKALSSGVQLSAQAVCYSFIL